MHIVIPADYQQAVKNLRCFQLLDGHTVTILSDYTTDVETLAAQFAKADAIVLIRERTKISGNYMPLPGLKLISQNREGCRTSRSRCLFKIQSGCSGRRRITHCTG